MDRFFNTGIAIILLISTLFISGCKQERIPDNDMISILVEVYITDALITTSQLTNRYARRDTIEYYKPIYSKFGYSEEIFLNTLDYLAENPSQLDRILDRVINELSKLETEYSAKKQSSSEDKPDENEGNLWVKKRSWTLPSDGHKETIGFKIPVKGLGTYTVTADVRVFPNDESEQPQIITWFYADDGTEDGYVWQIRSTQYRKDGNLQQINLANTLTDTTITHFFGYIMSHQPKEGDWKKSSQVANISIRFTPIPRYRQRGRERTQADTPEADRLGLKRAPQ